MKSVPQEVKKIAVLRANAVGDFIVALPALHAVRNRFPDAEIVLLGRHWHADFLRGRPGPVDRTVVIPFCKGIYDGPDDAAADTASQKEFFSRMHLEHFDIAFQFHGGGKYSNRFVRSLGARVTVGARTPDAPTLDRSIPYRQYQNETLRLLEIVSLVGSEQVRIEPRLVVTDQDLAEAVSVVPEDGRPLVVISPGSRDPRRRWPPRKFAAVADALAKSGARIIVNGDPAEKDAVQETLSCMNVAGQNVCGSLSLRGLAGLIARSRLVVSNDSGTLHLAHAVSTSSVGIYWFGNLLTYGPARCSRTAMHVSWRMHCPVCGAHCIQPGCVHRDSFVADVPTEEVTSSALELYNEEPVEE